MTSHKYKQIKQEVQSIIRNVRIAGYSCKVEAVDEGSTLLTVYSAEGSVEIPLDYERELVEQWVREA